MCVIFTPAFCSHYIDTGIRFDSQTILVMFLFQTFIIHFIISRRICWDRCGHVVACCDASLKCYMFDENILRSFGGMPRNSLTHILNVNNTDTSVDQEINLIQHSPY